jgi:hypothetical protein
MLWILLCIICIALAALSNATMDRLENLPAFNASVFYKKDAKFWLKEISWRYAKKIFGYKIDAWHIAKSAMVCFLILAVILPLIFDPPNLKGYLTILIYVAYGIVWNAVFNFSYNKLLKRKK